MAELLIAGDRQIIEILAEVREIAKLDGQPIWPAIKALELALAQNAGGSRLERTLIRVAAAAIVTIVRIRTSQAGART